VAHSGLGPSGSIPSGQPGPARAGGPGPVEGVLVIDKPAGPTSHDVVARVRRLFSTRRVGHAGTLDPPATGVLLVGLGRATRLMRFLQSLEKVYAGTVVFGVSTTTQDATGEVVGRRPCTVTEEALRAEARRFVGAIEQVPPMVSAVKVGGEPLHRAARRGEVVDRPPRPVRIHDLTVESYDPAAATAEICVHCSSGTYVRTLASDLGDRLGCGAHLSALRRLAIGSFLVSEAATLRALESMERAERQEAVLPMAAALRDFPSVAVEGRSLEGVRNGRPIDLEAAAAKGPVAVLDPAGELIAVYEPSAHAGDPPGRLRPAAVLATATEPRAPSR
jgi:tRNA pseudouridine55 synthase